MEYLVICHIVEQSHWHMIRDQGFDGVDYDCMNMPTKTNNVLLTQRGMAMAMTFPVQLLHALLRKHEPENWPAEFGFTCRRIKYKSWRVNIL